MHKQKRNSREILSEANHLLSNEGLDESPLLGLQNEHGLLEDSKYIEPFECGLKTPPLLKSPLQNFAQAFQAQNE